MEVYSSENLIELNGDLIFSSKPCLITGCIWWWMEGAIESLGAMVLSSFFPKKVWEPRNYISEARRKGVACFDLVLRINSCAIPRFNFAGGIHNARVGGVCGLTGQEDSVLSRRRHILNDRGRGRHRYWKGATHAPPPNGAARKKRPDRPIPWRTWRWLRQRRIQDRRRRPTYGPAIEGPSKRPCTWDDRLRWPVEMTNSM